MSNFKVHVSKDHLIFCFVTLKRLMRTLVDQLDHRTRLPESNPCFRITHENGKATSTVQDRRHVLPESDVLILPLSNTTAEKLAEYLAGPLRPKIGNTVNLTACELEVSEVEGQLAIDREEWR